MVTVVMSRVRVLFSKRTAWLGRRVVVGVGVVRVGADESARANAMVMMMGLRLRLCERMMMMVMMMVIAVDESAEGILSLAITIYLRWILMYLLLGQAPGPELGDSLRLILPPPGFRSFPCNMIL